MKTDIVIDISLPIWYVSDKILVLELWAKFTSDNQIAVFFQM